MDAAPCFEYASSQAYATTRLQFSKKFCMVGNSHEELIFCLRATYKIKN